MPQVVAKELLHLHSKSHLPASKRGRERDTHLLPRKRPQCSAPLAVYLTPSLFLLPFSRHRLSEADEDEELLEAEDDDLESGTITMFTDSPYC